MVAVSRLLDSHPIRLALAAADQANLAVILSRQVFEEVVRPGGGSLHETDFRRVTVTVTVKECSAQAWLRLPGLSPDELAVGDAMATMDRAAATAWDAAGG